MPVLKEYINPDLIEFKNLLIKHYPDLNVDNAQYILELYSFVYTDKIKGMVDFNSKCQLFFKQFRNGKSHSFLSKEYWISMGHSIEYASNKVSESQKINSPLNKEHWLKKGFSENDAIIKIKEIQSNRSNLRYEKYTKEEISRQSTWSIDYWINKGFSKEDAIKKVHEKNYSCREFWNSDDEYNEIKKIISKKTSDFIKNNPEIYKSFFGSISKEEISFFKDISTHINNIKHIEFIVNIKKSKELEQGIIKYDGYFKDDDSLILIEYDGLYWHKQDYDEIKDKICLETRNDVNGIIRISCDAYKNNNKIINLIQDAIRKIKNKECNRVKIY
jgi:hypothetical protein